MWHMHVISTDPFTFFCDKLISSWQDTSTKMCAKHLFADMQPSFGWTFSKGIFTHFEQSVG